MDYYILLQQYIHYNHMMGLFYLMPSGASTAVFFLPYKAISLVLNRIMSCVSIKTIESGMDMDI